MGTVEREQGVEPWAHRMASSREQVDEQLAEDMITTSEENP